MMSPIIAMLHDQSADRWHPIIFREAPLPGPPSGGVPRRWKSQGHHTEGFGSRGEALRHARGELAEKVRGVSSGGLAFALEGDIPWDGEGIPAMVSFFKVDGEDAELIF